MMEDLLSFQEKYFKKGIQDPAPIKNNSFNPKRRI
jgi:hypothetical protein